jgi:hypothetical protein
VSTVRKVFRYQRRSGPELSIAFQSIEVRKNGWGGPSGASGSAPSSDLSLIVQVENPGAPAETRILVTDRLPFSASAGQTVTAADLVKTAGTVPIFKRPIVVTDHVNIHVRYFIERTNVLGPIVGAALNTVIDSATGRIPLLPEPGKDALHLQIGKTIATELARATVIIPVEPSMEGHHDVTVELVSPRTLPGLSMGRGGAAGVLVTEGEVAAIARLGFDLKLKPLQLPKKG